MKYGDKVKIIGNTTADCDLFKGLRGRVVLVSKNKIQVEFKERSLYTADIVTTRRWFPKTSIKKIQRR